MNADIAKLLDAGVSEQVILQTIAVSQPNFDLSPDALIALKNKGATPAVLSAMLSTAEGASATTPSADATAPSADVPAAQPVQPAPTVVVTQPVQNTPAVVTIVAPPSVEPGQVSFAYFQNQLDPYGNWVQIPRYGWCWQPTVGVQDGAWRPYCDSGHWNYTDEGWYWESDYPWGDVVFHYGRWTRMTGYGWIWVPDYTWAPSWVAWRHAESEGCIGWAPLPPDARFVVGVGLTWGGRMAFDVDFGLGPDDFFFIGSDYYWDHNLRAHRFMRERAEFLWRHSAIHNGYRFNNGRFIVEGIGHQRIEVLTHHPVRPIAVRELSRRDAHDHFVARRNEVTRHFEARHDAPRADNVRHEPGRPGEIQRGKPVQQHNDNVRVPPAEPGRRVEPVRQAPPVVNPPRQEQHAPNPQRQAPAQVNQPRQVQPGATPQHQLPPAQVNPPRQVQPVAAPQHQPPAQVNQPRPVQPVQPARAQPAQPARTQPAAKTEDKKDPNAKQP
jgi:hypothetical protein